MHLAGKHLEGGDIDFQVRATQCLLYFIEFLAFARRSCGTRCLCNAPD